MRKHILIAIAAIVVPVILLVAEYLYLDNTRSTQQLTVNYSDASSVELWHGDDKVQSGVVDGSKLTIKLQDDSYKLKYQGLDGFTDGEVAVPKNSDSISITPAYDDEVLADMYATEKTAIVAALHNAYPDSEELYDIKNDRLYQRGDWFGATLEYKGDSYFGRDSLGLIMHRQDGDKWTLVTKPPMPSVNIHTYPEAPIEVIDAINDQLFS